MKHQDLKSNNHEKFWYVWQKVIMSKKSCNISEIIEQLLKSKWHVALTGHARIWVDSRITLYFLLCKCACWRNYAITFLAIDCNGEGLHLVYLHTKHMVLCPQLSWSQREHVFHQIEYLRCCWLPSTNNVLICVSSLWLKKMKHYEMFVQVNRFAKHKRAV